jgi:hypothetical protein
MVTAIKEYLMCAEKHLNDVCSQLSKEVDLGKQNILNTLKAFYQGQLDALRFAGQFLWG